MCLCTVDYRKLYTSSESSKATIAILKQNFARYRILDEVISDNGPQFSSKEFAKFVKDYECNYTTTSPHYQQANEQVERSVQTVKDLMTKSKDINKALDRKSVV